MATAEFDVADLPGSPKVQASGVAKVECAVDDEPFATCSSPFAKDYAKLGTAKITVRATDVAGNQALNIHYSTVKDSVKAATIPFLTINPQGGASLAGNILPITVNQELLTSYSLLGQGSTAAVISNIVRDFDALWFANSGVLAGMRSAIRAEDKSKVRVFAVPVRSQDDTSSNPLDISHGVRDAGRVGSFIAGISSRRDGVSGISMQSAFDGATRFSETISRFSDLQIVAPAISDHDPRLNPQLSSIFGINPATPDGSALALPTYIHNLLNDNVGSAGFTMGGFDYHGQARAQTDARDQDLGRAIGQAAAAALAMNKPLFIYIVTDGSNASVNSDIPGSPWVSDRGVAGMQMFVVVDPLGLLEAPSSEADYMIGGFTNSQVADDRYWSPASSNQSIAAMAVFANYLAFNGMNDSVPNRTAGKIPNGYDRKFIRLKLK